MNDGCEVAISRTGWGPCHHFLVILCGLCTLAEATASLIVIVVSPLLACDLNLFKEDVILMNGTSSLGMAFGALLFGTIADTRGRKSSIPITMVVTFCASVIFSFSRRISLINVAIFILGMGIAGNNVALRVYLVECMPSKRRGACLAMLDLLWVVGYMAALGISWSLVPSVVRMLGNEFRPSSWRVLAGLGGGPSLIMACVASLLPSSPRYLLYRQHPDRALAVLQQIYAVNNSRHVDQYMSGRLDGCINPDEDEDFPSSNFFAPLFRHCSRTWRRIRKISCPPFRKTTILASLARIFLFPGLIWLAAWKTHLSFEEDEHRLHRGNNSICTTDTGDIAQGFLRNCHEVNSSRFEYSMLFSTSYVLAGVALVIGIDVVGRRLSIVSSGLVGGTAILALVFVTRRAARTLFSVLFLASFSIINTTTNIAILENYPTSVRGTIVGLTSVLPHLAAFFSQFFARVYCEQSVYIATGLIIGATLTAAPIPDFTRAPMYE